MAETPKINFNDWTLGISPDEYLGGSYFYAEGINSQSSSKGFRLGDKVLEYGINKRVNGTVNKIEYLEGQPLFFTNDGYLEYSYSFVGSPSEFFTAGSGGGGLFRRSDSSLGYLNGIKLGNKIYGVLRDKIDVITLGSTGTLDMFGTNLITNPELTSDTNWTVGTGRTTGANGAVHTSGTATLKQQVATVNGAKYRIAVKFTRTAGSLTVRIGTGAQYNISSQTDTWALITPLTAGGDNLEIIFTPSTDFAGSIQYVEVNEYTATIEENKITITNYSHHPMLYSQGYLYVGCGSNIDFIDPVTLVKNKTLSVIDSTYEIIALTEVGNSIIIWATDGNNSKQYYRDGISSSPTEIINWKGLKISAVTCDGVINYVVTDGTGAGQQVFAVQGYTRTPLAEYQSDGRFTGNDWSVYHPSKKFNFYTHTPNCIAIHDEMLYVPCKGGIYNYGAKVTGLRASWNKQLVFSTDLTDYVTAMEVIGGNPIFTYDKAGTNSYGVGVDYYNTDSGYLLTNPIYWDDIGTNKDLTKIRIGYGNIPKTLGNIKVYAIVDDFYFWRTTVSNISVVPVVGSRYRFSTFAYLEVISTDLTLSGGKYSGTITFKAYDLQRISRYQITATGTLTKVSGTGDSSIAYTAVTHSALIKTIESDKQEYGNELIFSKNFIDVHMPKRHKLQLMIELTSSAGNQRISPEIYDIYILSDITDQNV